MSTNIQLNALFDSGSHYSSYWKWGPADILIEEIAAVGFTHPSLGKSLVVLRSGRQYHCQEEPNEILATLKQHGWEEPITVKAATASAA